MISKLIQSLIDNKEEIPYLSLNDKNQYNGWTKNFNYKLPNGENMKLDLNVENDLFLLFILASSWSKTGPWENATFFVGYLKYYNMDSPQFWKEINEMTKLQREINNNLDYLVSSCKGINPRKKVSFRSDFYNSIIVLTDNWNEIKNKLKESEEKNDYFIFINYISEIKGLGAGMNKMRIKIPLILRELRCQNIYKGIPGELCCVPDKRVIDASKEVNINLPTITSIKSILKASAIIYEKFGDLYDIPLFAYEDVKKYM